MTTTAREQYLKRLDVIKAGTTVRVLSTTTGILTVETVERTTKTQIVTRNVKGHENKYRKTDGTALIGLSLISSIVRHRTRHPDVSNTRTSTRPNTAATQKPIRKRYLLVTEEGFQYKEIDSTDYASEAVRLAAYHEDILSERVLIMCTCEDRKLLKSQPVVDAGYSYSYPVKKA